MKADFATVTSKGQLVIPAKMRRKFGIRKGTRVALVEQDHHILLQPITREFIRSLQGSLKGGPSALKILLRERKREREL